MTQQEMDGPLYTQLCHAAGLKTLFDVNSRNVVSKYDIPIIAIAKVSKETGKSKRGPDYYTVYQLMDITTLVPVTMNAFLSSPKDFPILHPEGFVFDNVAIWFQSKSILIIKI